MSSLEKTPIDVYYIILSYMDYRTIILLGLTNKNNYKISFSKLKKTYKKIEDRLVHTLKGRKNRRKLCLKEFSTLYRFKPFIIANILDSKYREGYEFIQKMRRVLERYEMDSKQLELYNGNDRYQSLRKILFSLDMFSLMVIREM